MATTKITAALAQSQASAIATAISTNATLKIYTGTMPSTPETSASGTLLATVTIASVSASGGVVTAADPDPVTPATSGTAGWARLATSGGTAICDMDVSDSAGSGALKLGTTSLSTGVSVDITSFTLTVPVA